MLTRRRLAALAAALPALALAASLTPALALTDQPYDAAAVKKAIASGKPVAIHVNASWCLQCRAQASILGRLAKEGRGVDPLHALLDLYADRGDPSLARNVHSIVRIDSRPVIERLQIDGPMCFGRGTEVTLHVDQSVLAGQSMLLLSALLARLFARHAGINGFVRTRTRLLQKQEDVPWPMTPGNRYLI